MARRGSRSLDGRSGDDPRAIGGFVFYELPGSQSAGRSAATDDDPVEGRQFYWLFRYPNGAISISKMIAPANEVVNEDVIYRPIRGHHSWWVPDSAASIDAIPGRTNQTWFEAPVGTTRPLRRLCGIQHA